MDRSLEYEKMSLANWVRKFIEKCRLDEIIDPLVVGQIADDCLRKYGETAFQFLRDMGILHPTMVDVVASLELILKLQDNVDVATSHSPLDWDVHVRAQSLEGKAQLQKNLDLDLMWKGEFGPESFTCDHTPTSKIVSHPQQKSIRYSNAQGYQLDIA